MNSFSELMFRHSELMRVWMERCVKGEQYSVGPILHKSGQLILPVYRISDNVRVEDLMMATGETKVTRIWGKGPLDWELLEV